MSEVETQYLLIVCTKSTKSTTWSYVKDTMKAKVFTYFGCGDQIVFLVVQDRIRGLWPVNTNRAVRCDCVKEVAMVLLMGLKEKWVCLQRRKQLSWIKPAVKN